MTSEKAPELKPCPFCGEPGSIIDDPDHSRAFRGGCTDDDCPAFDIIYEMSEAEAIEAWHRRRADVSDAMVTAAYEAAAYKVWLDNFETAEEAAEQIRSLTPSDARAALAEAERKAWEAGRDAAEAKLRFFAIAAAENGNRKMRDVFSAVAVSIASLKKETEA